MAPNRSSSSGSRRARLRRVARASRRTRTWPAGHDRCREERRGARQVGLDRRVDARRSSPGRTAQVVGGLPSPSTPRSRSIAAVIARCGAFGTGRSPTWRISTPSLVRAPASSSALTSWLDDEASICTAPPRTAPVPWTANGSAPRPPSSMIARRAPAARRAAGRPAAAGRRRRRRSRPSPATAPRAAARSAARCRRCRRRSRPGRSREATGRRPSRRRRRCRRSCAPSARSAATMSVVSRLRSGLVQRDCVRRPAPRGPARGWSSTSSRGRRTSASTGSAANGAFHGSAVTSRWSHRLAHACAG